MLTDKTWEYVGIIIPICECIGGIPCSWNKDRKLLVFSLKGQRRQRIIFGTQTFWLIFMLGQAIRARENEDFTSFNLLSLFMIVGILILVMISLPAFIGREVVSTVNLALFYLQRMKRTYMPKCNPNTYKDTRITNVLLMITISGLTLSMFFVLILTTTFPNLPIFYMSVIPENLIGVRILLQLEAYYSAVVPHVVIGSWGMAIITYACLIIPFGIREFNMVRSDHLCNKKLKTPAKFINMFRAFQILNEAAMDLTAVYLLPLQALCTYFLVFCSYMLIRYDGHMSGTSKCMFITWLLLSVSAYSFILCMGGFLYSNGVKILGSWKRHDWGSKKDKLLMKRFHLSCQPLSFHFGKTFTVKKISAIKYIRGVTRGIFRALLLTQRK